MRARSAQRVALALAAAAFAVLVLLAGCGGGSATTGGSGSATTGAGGTRRARDSGGQTQTAAEGVKLRLRKARRRLAGLHHVQEGQMVAGEAGWVRSEVGLFWTPDGGRTWRPITPPVPEAARIQGVWFAGPRRGWALYEPGKEGDARPSIYMTTDGGRTWHRSRLRAYRLFMPATSVSFSLVDGHELFALVKEEGDTASNFGTLLVSDDAGRQWRALPSPPQAGPISFETPRRGWLAGGTPAPKLWRTRDGGRTWVQVKPGGRRGSSLPKSVHPGLGGMTWDAYTTPLIGAEGSGILGMIEANQGNDGIPTVVWRTTDYGRTWHRTDRIMLPGVSGFFEADDVFTHRGRSLDFFVHDPLGGAYTVVGTDGRAGPLRASRGLPHHATATTFSDGRHGFAYPNFSSHSSLVFTEDGGRNWTHVVIPRAPPWPESLAPAAIAGPRIIHRSPSAHGRVRGRPGAQAAGVCPAPKGPKVVAYLSSGVPILPCYLVSPHQHLEIANVTGNDGEGHEPPRVETFSLAGFHARLAPGRAVLLDGPIGDYLGPGNHIVGSVTGVDIRLDHKARCEAPKPPPCPGGP
jgi:photosystem II stability/assembly factor-like uncharacterized protein